MNRFLFVALAAACVGAAQAGSLSFNQVKTIDVSTFFTGADNAFASGRHGESVGSIAFDGTNAYVSGYSTSNKRAGVVKITDVLTTHSIASSQVQTVARGASLVAGSGRTTKVALDGSNNIFWGYGLGESSTTASTGDTDSAGPNFGIRKLDSSGTSVAAWSPRVSGINTYNVLTGYEAQGNVSGSREDSFAFDSVNNQLLTVDFFKGSVFRVDASTGAYLGSSTIEGSAALGTGTGQYRDMAYDALTGRLFMRSTIASSPNHAARQTTEVYTYDSGTNTFKRTANLQAGNSLNDGSLARIAYGNSSVTGEFLVMNDTSNNTLKVISASTGTVFATLNGTENGGTAFSFAGLSSSIKQGADGYLYMLVSESTAYGGTSTDRVRVYQIVPEPGTVIAMAAGLVALVLRRKNSR